jgi:hypothetical protein
MNSHRLLDCFHRQIEDDDEHDQGNSAPPLLKPGLPFAVLILRRRI